MNLNFMLKTSNGKTLNTLEEIQEYLSDGASRRGEVLSIHGQRADRKNILAGELIDLLNEPIKEIEHYFDIWIKERVRILNLTQHEATDVQKEKWAVMEPNAADKKKIQEFLTFEEVPSKEEIQRRAQMLTNIATSYRLGDYVSGVMIGGAPFLMGPLERELANQKLDVKYAFTKRESVEEPDGDGGVKKTAVFKHVGFVAAAIE